MRVCILIFNDGRNEYLRRTLSSFNEMVEINDCYKILIDDNPLNRNQVEIDKIVSDFNIDQVILNDSNLGVFGTVQKAWRFIPQDCEYVFHLENDFLFNEFVDVNELVEVLESSKKIFQIALLRQDWFAFEKKVGGIYKAYSPWSEMKIGKVDLVLHRHYFTHNPCVYHKRYAIQTSGYNEYGYMKVLRRVQQNGYCAYLGTLKDKPKVTHIGELKIHDIR